MMKQLYRYTQNEVDELLVGLQLLVNDSFYYEERDGLLYPITDRQEHVRNLLARYGITIGIAQDDTAE